jgi:hypothetical protein
MICAICSWVSASLTFGSDWLVLVAVHSNSKRARRSGAEWEKPQTADLPIGALAIFAEVLGRLQAGIPVGLEELQEVLALNKVKLAGLSGLGGDLVGSAGHGSVHAQNLAGLRDFKDEGFSFCRSGGKFYPPLT